LPRSTHKAIALLPPGRAKGATRHRSSFSESAAVQTILDVVCAIPRGSVSTYGAVARAAGLPGRARLTGYALKRAPDTLNIPWHRVLGAGGRIVFPRYSTSYREQAQRLRAEGVRVRSGRVDRVFLTDLESL
jgi:methylated-DNA-protein-cysteine methyltransferase related protein